MDRVFIKPVEGRRVKDPHTYELLTTRGKNVVRNSYWLRRLRDGDVYICDQKKS